MHPVAQAVHVEPDTKFVAIHLPLVDMLMGTFKLPRKQEAWPEEYGVMKLETVPRGILRQHAMPFLGKKKYDDYVA